MNNEFIIAGIMSGTSLDGLDACIVEFKGTSYSVLHAETICYTSEIVDSLNTAHLLPVDDFIMLHNRYGRYIGSELKKIILSKNISVDFVASHGHTILHRPDKGYTFQIGSGTEIAAELGIPVISDFRSLDVALGGQGAPLVPIGDALLFKDYDYCINIGGFSNISYQQENRRIAFDISPANYVLNYLCTKLNKAFDEDGTIAKKGKSNELLLEKLNANDYFKCLPPKSLGREWVEEHVYPVIENFEDSIHNKIATYTEHIAFQIGKICKGSSSKALITGGGALNSYLIERIKQYSECEIFVPEKTIIEFKEALIFAYLGYLRVTQSVNTLKSVTGASRNSIGGVISLF